MILQNNNIVFYIYPTENHSDCSPQLHLLIQPVQPYIPALYTQVTQMLSSVGDGFFT